MLEGRIGFGWAVWDGCYVMACDGMDGYWELGTWDVGSAVRHFEEHMKSLAPMLSHGIYDEFSNSTHIAEHFWVRSA